MATYKPQFKNTEATQFVLDEYTCGFAQCVDNNWNFAIYARNPDVSIYQNEYNAGYVQGKVQTNAMILATRNNSWRNFLIGATPQDAPLHRGQATVSHRGGTGHSGELQLPSLHGSTSARTTPRCRK